MAIGAGSVIIVTLLIVAILWWCISRQTKKQNDRNEEMTAMSYVSSHAGTVIAGTTMNQARMPHFSHIQHAGSDKNLTQIIYQQRDAPTVEEINR